MLKPKQLNDIYRAIDNSGGRDPFEGGKQISHKESKEFIKDCASDRGLNDKYYNFFKKGEELRVYVNYGPRMSIKNGPSFGDCKTRPESVDNFISKLDNCLLEGIKWSQSNSLNEGYSTMLAIHHIDKFLDNPELFYLEWCSQDTINKSKIFLRELSQEIK